MLSPRFDKQNLEHLLKQILSEVYPSKTLGNVTLLLKSRSLWWVPLQSFGKSSWHIPCQRSSMMTRRDLSDDEQIDQRNLDLIACCGFGRYVWVSKARFYVLSENQGAFGTGFSSKKLQLKVSLSPWGLTSNRENLTVPESRRSSHCEPRS